jgi:tRNA U34 5-carboxymethylaminomethyl modifying GTPase MnmE/TrmE
MSGLLLLFAMLSSLCAALRPYPPRALPSVRGHFTHSVRHMKARLVDEGSEAQFEVWATEEVELQRLAMEKEKVSLREAGEAIPHYMLEILNECGPPAVEPTREGMLPIIAVIGRPNTGKSTIVNKLADSYKVAIC